jgi:hypothetical protein
MPDRRPRTTTDGMTIARRLRLLRRRTARWFQPPVRVGAAEPEPADHPEPPAALARDAKSPAPSY